MAAIALRTLAAGTIACLMTACVAGEICNLFVVVFFFFFFLTHLYTDSLRNYHHLRPVRVFEHRVHRGGIRWTWPHG